MVASEPMRAVTCWDDGAWGADMAASATTSSKESSSADSSDMAHPNSTCAACTGAKISSMALKARPMATMIMPSHWRWMGSVSTVRSEHQSAAHVKDGSWGQLTACNRFSIKNRDSSATQVTPDALMTAGTANSTTATAPTAHSTGPDTR